MTKLPYGPWRPLDESGYSLYYAFGGREPWASRRRKDGLPGPAYLPMGKAGTP